VWFSGSSKIQLLALLLNAGFIIEALTDNVNRTAGDVKSAITKAGGKAADSGSVMFNFMRQGQIIVDKTDEDAVFEAAMEAGAEDIQPVTDDDGVPTTSFKVSFNCIIVVKLGNGILPSLHCHV
jgi:transcriptional/translational regulatory protein YebC/TACO1